MELQNHPIFLLFEGKFQTLLNNLLNNALLNVTHLPSYFFELFLFSIGLFFSLYESMKDREWFLVYFLKKARGFFVKEDCLNLPDVINKFISVS